MDKLCKCIPLILSKGWVYITYKASLPLPAEFFFDGESNSVSVDQEKARKAMIYILLKEKNKSIRRYQASEFTWNLISRSHEEWHHVHLHRTLIPCFSG